MKTLSDKIKPKVKTRVSGNAKKNNKGCKKIHVVLVFLVNHFVLEVIGNMELLTKSPFGPCTCGFGADALLGMWGMEVPDRRHLRHCRLTRVGRAACSRVTLG